jgi:peptidyl-prolyl cis-trans isomerase SurA
MRRLFAAAAALATFVAPVVAHAIVVERVVAVVGERPILLSDVRYRSKPVLLRIAAQTPNPAELASLEPEVYKETLNRMVDERLVEIAAEKAKVSVSAKDIDDAIAKIAQRAQVSVDQVVSEARRTGLSEQEYREEVRRQLLEGNLVQLRLRGRVRVTEDDARATYTRLVAQIQKENPIEARILALRVIPDSTKEQEKARETLAFDLAKRARDGEDFCKIVTDYTDDVDTRTTCGSRGAQPFAAYLPELQKAIASVKPGETAEPVHVGEAWLVVQVAKATTLPAFEAVKDAMLERAQNEALDKQRRSWLEEIKKQTYVDIRL